MNIQTAPHRVGFTSLFKNIFKRSYGITLLYTALCFVGCPLILMLVKASRIMADVDDSFKTAFIIGTALLSGLAILFSLVLSSKLFGYMHNKSAVDVYHALPVKRSRLFLVNYLVGILLLLLPLLLNFLIALIFYSGPFDASFWSSYFTMLGQFFLSAVEIFTFCVFFHVTCGTGFGACLYNILLNIGYLGSVVIISISVSSFLPGYSGDLPAFTLFLLSPMGRIFLGAIFPLLESSSLFPFYEWLIHLGLTLAIFLLSFFLYKKRKSESAGDSFAFSIPKFIVRLIVTTGVALFFAFIFFQINPTAFQIFFGVLIGGALAHVILELIFSKGLGSLVKSIPAFLVFIALFTMGYIFIATGWFGFDTRIPKPEEVASVTLFAYGGDYYDNGNYLYDEIDYENYIWGESDEIKQSNFVFAEQENIQNGIALHQMAVDALAGKKPYVPTSSFDVYNDEMENMVSIALNYTLKNGKTMVRRYQVKSTSATTEIFRKLADSKENRLYLLGLVGYNHPPFRYDIRVSNTSEKLLLTLKSGQTKELLECLKQDVQNLKEQQKNPKQVLGTKYIVDIIARSDSLGSDFNYPVSQVTDKFAITADFPKTLAFLQNAAALKPAA